MRRTSRSEQKHRPVKLNLQHTMWRGTCFSTPSVVVTSPILEKDPTRICSLRVLRLVLPFSSSLAVIQMPLEVFSWSRVQETGCFGLCGPGSPRFVSCSREKKLNLLVQSYAPSLESRFLHQDFQWQSASVAERTRKASDKERKICENPYWYF